MLSRRPRAGWRLHRGRYCAPGVRGCNEGASVQVFRTAGKEVHRPDGLCAEQPDSIQDFIGSYTAMSGFMTMIGKNFIEDADRYRG